jgi:hypothetical protein
MPAYHNVESSTRARRWTPVREVIIAHNGALLAAGRPRYDRLSEYIDQFAAPLSQLSGQGLYSFYDPCLPELTLVVECEGEPLCERCEAPEEACECMF